MQNNGDIKIVYFLYLDPGSDWATIVSGQLNQLKRYGILDVAELYVHITDVFNLGEAAVSLVNNLIPKAIVSINYENLYEYPGIKRVHDLAIRHPDAKFIYFHAKGMSHKIQQRLPQEVALFTRTYENWQNNIKLLGTNGIEKIGLFPGALNEKQLKKGDLGGWIWYNFWYASGTYLAACPEPKITNDKYYYEGWLGIHNGNTLINNDCLSLFSINFVTQDYFSGPEADHYLHLLSGNKQSAGNSPSNSTYSFLMYCRLKFSKFFKIVWKRP